MKHNVRKCIDKTMNVLFRLLCKRPSLFFSFIIIIIIIFFCFYLGDCSVIMKFSPLDLNAIANKDKRSISKGEKNNNNCVSEEGEK